MDARWRVSSISGQRFAGSNIGECLQSFVATWMLLMFSCVAILSRARQGGSRSPPTYSLVFPELYSTYYSTATRLSKQLTLLSTKFYIFPFHSLLALSLMCPAVCPSAPTGWCSVRLSRKLHGAQYTRHNLKYLLAQRRISYNDVYFLLINSKIL